MSYQDNPFFITQKELELKQMLCDLYTGKQKLAEDGDKLKELEQKAIHLDGYITGLKEHSCQKNETTQSLEPKSEPSELNAKTAPNEA